MNLTLRRSSFTEEGIFGNLFDENGNLLFATLEHSYDCVPKLAPGTYTCVRHPPNRLPYETFMVVGVPDFQGQPVVGILLHIGNFNRDSEGCILIGSDSEGAFITDSKIAFAKFMSMLIGVDSFQLTVK